MCVEPFETAAIDGIAVHVGSGATPRGGSEVYKSEGVLFIRSQNVRFSGLELDDVVFIDDRTHRAMARSEVFPADVLLNITGASIGRCCVLPSGVGPANVNQHVCAIRLPSADHCDASFLSAVLGSHIGQAQVARLNAGGNREGLNFQQIRAFVVPWPSAGTRRRIAEILDTLDEAIRRTEQVIAKLQQMKQGLLHDLLTRGIDENGELRDPERHPEQFQDSPLGRIPKSWSFAKLGAIARETGGLIQTGPFGSQLHAHEYVAEGVPVIMPQDIRGERVDESQIARITERRANELSRHRVRGGDTVFARRGDLSRCLAVGAGELGWLCGTGCLLVRAPGSTLAAEWLAAVYRHDLGQRQVLGQAVGSTMINLNGKILGNLVLPIPSPEEQQRYTEQSDSMRLRISTETAELAKLWTLKQGLMDDLLTGRVRVRVPEEASA